MPSLAVLCCAGPILLTLADHGADASHRCGVGAQASIGKQPNVLIGSAGPDRTSPTVSPIINGVVSVVVAGGRFTVAASPGEHFYGLGERFRGPDLRGQVLEGWTQDREVHPERPGSYVATPFLLSSRGYAILLDSDARSTFDIAATDPGCVLVEVDEPRARVTVIEGPDPRQVLQRHADIVGHPPLPPPWAFGVWKNLIGGDAQVEHDLDRLTSEGIPVDAVWIYDALDPASGFGWRWQIYGPVPPGNYSELPALIGRLHARGIKVLGYLNPFVYEGTAAFDDAADHGYLVRDARGDPAVFAWKHHAYVDFTNPAATGWWKARIRAGLVVAGFDGAMLDFGEDAPVDGVYADGAPGAIVHNRYPVLYAQAAKEAAEEVKPGATVFFARSGYTGSEQYVTGGFTGDQERSWDVLRGLPSVIPALLSAGISGRPYWGPDIAGFIDGPPLSDEKELWMRWLELGALTPTMRDMLGAQRAPVDVWTDRDTAGMFAVYARLHASLEPYLARQAVVAHETGLPLVRPVFLDYPAETAAYGVDDEYLLGTDILVAPVVRPATSHRTVYFPAGWWRDAWSGAIVHGAVALWVAAPINRIPIYERVGSGLGLVDLVRTALDPAPRAL